MTQPLQYGRNYLAAIQAFLSAYEDMQFYAQMAVGNSTLIADNTVPGSYLNAPGARTDLTGPNFAALQQAALALATWMTTASSATNNVAPLTQFVLAE